MSKCTNCGGTGYDSAARRAGLMDAPFMQQPLGIWPCDSCGGTGKAWEPPKFTEEDKRKFKRNLERVLNRLKKKEA